MTLTAPLNIPWRKRQDPVTKSLSNWYPYLGRWPWLKNPWKLLPSTKRQRCMDVMLLLFWIWIFETEGHTAWHSCWCWSRAQWGNIAKWCDLVLDLDLWNWRSHVLLLLLKLLWFIQMLTLAIFLSKDSTDILIAGSCSISHWGTCWWCGPCRASHWPHLLHRAWKGLWSDRGRNLHCKVSAAFMTVLSGSESGDWWGVRDSAPAVSTQLTHFRSIYLRQNGSNKAGAATTKAAKKARAKAGASKAKPKAKATARASKAKPKAAAKARASRAKPKATAKARASKAKPKAAAKARASRAKPKAAAKARASKAKPKKQLKTDANNVYSRTYHALKRQGKTNEEARHFEKNIWYTFMSLILGRQPMQLDKLWQMQLQLKQLARSSQNICDGGKKVWCSRAWSVDWVWLECQLAWLSV